jgi:hypothetical protein
MHAKIVLSCVVERVCKWANKFSYTSLMGRPMSGQLATMSLGGHEFNYGRRKKSRQARIVAEKKKKISRRGDTTKEGRRRRKGARDRRRSKSGSQDKREK